MADNSKERITQELRHATRSDYVRPALKTYGHVGALTQGATGSMGMEGGGMGMGMGMAGLGGGFGLA